MTQKVTQRPLPPSVAPPGTGEWERHADTFKPSVDPPKLRGIPSRTPITTFQTPVHQTSVAGDGVCVGIVTRRDAGRLLGGEVPIISVCRDSLRK